MASLTYHELIRSVPLSVGIWLEALHSHPTYHAVLRAEKTLHDFGIGGNAEQIALTELDRDLTDKFNTTFSYIFETMGVPTTDIADCVALANQFYIGNLPADRKDVHVFDKSKLPDRMQLRQALKEFTFWAKLLRYKH